MSKVKEIWQAFEHSFDRLLMSASDEELACMFVDAGKLPGPVKEHVRFRVEIEQNYRKGSKPRPVPPQPTNVIHVDFTARTP